MKDTLSIIPYYGGKARMAKFIADRLDYLSTDIYIEPFGGACRVLLNKPRHKVEIYNDYGEGVCALMRVMSNPATAREFIYRLEETEYSQEEFNRQKAIYYFFEQDIVDDPEDAPYLPRTRDMLNQSISDMTLAIATYVTFTQSRDAMGQVWSGYLFKDTAAYHNRLVRLLDCAERMDGVRVQQIDAMQFFRQAADYGIEFETFGDYLNNERVMMYCDPSYISPSAEAAALKKQKLDISSINIDNGEEVSEQIDAKNLGELYAMSYGYKDHEKFLKGIRHKKCKLAVSNYDLQLYNKYLSPDAGWRRIEFETFATGKKNNRRTEVIWYNY